MAAGLTTINASGELTLSSDGITYGYIGRASLTGVFQATGGSITKASGRSTYTITWPGDIVVALPVKSNGTTAITTMSQSGSTWTITVHKGSGAYDANGFDIQEATEVFVFGAPVSVSGFGLALYSASGALCADMSRRPLTYKSRIALGAGSLGWGMPGGVGIPAVVGFPSDRNVTSVSASPYFVIRYQGRGWQLNGGTIERNIFQIRWLRQDGGATPEDTIRPINAVLIDANGL